MAGEERVGAAAIELRGDSSKLRAAVRDAKRDLTEFGNTSKTVSKSASDSIDRYVQRLQVQSKVLGKSTREQELYRLAVRGASVEQLRAADHALKMAEAYGRGERIGRALTRSAYEIGRSIAVVSTTLVAGVVALDRYISKAGSFQDAAEKLGDSAENVASLARAANASGLGMDRLVQAAVRLTANLTETTDESRAAGAAIKALGLDIDSFKKLSATEQIEAIAVALDGFQESSDKTAVAYALLGKAGADALPFLKELISQGGRQVILTGEQIKAADDYADKNAVLRAELDLYAQSLATNAIPAQSAFIDALSGTLKELLGVKNGVNDLAANESIARFAERGVRAIAVLADGVFLLGQGFLTLGESIGAVAAIVGQLAQGNFGAALEIGRQLTARIGDTRFLLGLADELDRRLANSGSKIAAASKDVEGAGRADKDKPRLRFSGKVTGDRGSAAEARAEASAQLTADLDEIKRASAAVLAEYANRERVLEAMRSAGLVEERQYYAEKAQLASASAAETRRASEQQIARLQRENLTGKDKINNDRRIAAAQAELVVEQARANADATVLDIQRAASLTRVEQAYRVAEDAAQDYLASLRREQAAELAGFGAGNRERERTGGRNQIQQQFDDQRQALERQRRDAQLSGTFGPDAQKQYDDELARIRKFREQALAEYDEYYRRRAELERDASVGAREAIKNFTDESLNAAKITEELYTRGFERATDALTEFFTTGKLGYKELAAEAVASITRIIIQQRIAAAANSLFGESGTGGGLIGTFISSLVGGKPRAGGGGVAPNSIQLVNERGPELLEYGGSSYLMMGARGGNVVPNDAIGNTYVTVNQSFPPGTTRATTLNAAADLRRTLERTGRNV